MNKGSLSSKDENTLGKLNENRLTGGYLSHTHAFCFRGSAVSGNFELGIHWTYLMFKVFLANNPLQS